jgi:hypothetical protein
MRFKKLLRIILSTTLVIIALIISTSVVFSLFYEKAALRYIKKYLDENLETQLSMQDIRLRILKGFPNATIEISDITILSGKDFSAGHFSGSFSDTLLKANKIYMRFDVLGLLKKEFNLKKLEISQGYLNLLIDKNNHHNLKIWKNKESSQPQQQTFKLQGILLSSMEINFIALKEQIKFSAYTEKTNVKGEISGKSFLGYTKGKYLIHSLNIKDSPFLKNIPLHIDLKIAYSDNKFKIAEGKVVINKIAAGISGEYLAGKSTWLDFTLQVPKFSFGDILSLSPFLNSRIMKDYMFNGYGRLKVNIKGPQHGRKNYQLMSEFTLIDCKARNTLTKYEISKISVQGKVNGTIPGNLIIELNDINSKLGKGFVQGTVILSSAQKLHLQGQLHAEIDLDALVGFAGMDTIAQSKGTIVSDLQLKGDVMQDNDTRLMLDKLIERGDFTFRDVFLKLKNSPWNIQHANGKAVWDNGVRIDSVALQINSTQLLMNGTLHNLTEYLRKTGDLKANIDVITDNLDINNLLSEFSHGKSVGRAIGNTVFPSDIHLKADLTVGKFVAGKFNASDLRVQLIANNDSLYLSKFFLKFPDGSITGDAMIAGNSTHSISIICNSVSQNVNIQQLFSSFNNFTQHFIVDKNVKGKLGGTISFFAQWDSTLQFLPGSLQAKADFKITNGELIQFEPMLKLSKYIDADELKLIRFSTLKNIIFIENRMVTIPEMDIQSSAFNISVSGQHSFDNKFDYRMKVLLSEVMFKKARKKSKEIDDFLIEETKADQTTIPLIIKGTPENFDVRFDRKRAFDLTRKNLKGITDVGTYKPVTNNFIINWDETEIENDTIPFEKEKSGSSDFKIEWEEADSLNGK